MSSTSQPESRRAWDHARPAPVPAHTASLRVPRGAWGITSQRSKSRSNSSQWSPTWPTRSTPSSGVPRGQWSTGSLTTVASATRSPRARAMPSSQAMLALGVSTTASRPAAPFIASARRTDNAPTAIEPASPRTRTAKPAGGWRFATATTDLIPVSWLSQAQKMVAPIGRG